MNEITDKGRLELLNQTLRYLLVEDDNSLISESLNELEGDYYTFFNPHYIEELRKDDLISETVESGIIFLFKIISSIDARFWNVESFKNNDMWQKAKKIAMVGQGVIREI